MKRDDLVADPGRGPSRFFPVATFRHLREAVGIERRQAYRGFRPRRRWRRRSLGRCPVGDRGRARGGRAGLAILCCRGRIRRRCGRRQRSFDGLRIDGSFPARSPVGNRRRPQQHPLTMEQTLPPRQPRVVVWSCLWQGQAEVNRWPASGRDWAPEADPSSQPDHREPGQLEQGQARGGQRIRRAVGTTTAGAADVGATALGATAASSGAAGASTARGSSTGGSAWTGDGEPAAAAVGGTSPGDRLDFRVGHHGLL